MSFYGWKPYVSATARRKKAEKAAAKAKRAGANLSPVAASRGAIAKTFWGKAWCDNLERYSDYTNRLPRGRTYVRNGSSAGLAPASSLRRRKFGSVAVARTGLPCASTSPPCSTAWARASMNSLN